MNKLSAIELAKLLNGREIRNEITKQEEAQAKESGLVVVFGASDDLMEFRGAVCEEVDAYEGQTVYLTSTGLIENKCEDDCPYYENEKNSGISIEQIWDKGGYSWIYETTIPHRQFEIMDGDEKYCRGIVFALSDVGEQTEPEPAREFSDVKRVCEALAYFGHSYPDSQEEQAARYDQLVDQLALAVLEKKHSETPLGDEPDLMSIMVDGTNCTWGEKKQFCEMEAFSYFSNDAPITQNPYFKNTWPWQWFNNEYLRLVGYAS